MDERESNECPDCGMSVPAGGYHLCPDPEYSEEECPECGFLAGDCCCDVEGDDWDENDWEGE